MNKKSLSVAVLGVASLLAIAATPAAAADGEVVDCFYEMYDAHPACEPARPTSVRTVEAAPRTLTESVELAEAVDCFFTYNAALAECAAPKPSAVARSSVNPGSV